VSKPRFNHEGLKGTSHFTRWFRFIQPHKET